MPMLDSWQIADKIRSAAYLIRSLPSEFSPEEMEPALVLLKMAHHPMIGQEPARRKIAAALELLIQDLDTCLWDRPHDVHLGSFVDDDDKEALCASLLRIATSVDERQF